MSRQVCQGCRRMANINARYLRSPPLSARVVGGGGGRRQPRGAPYHRSSPDPGPGMLSAMEEVAKCVLNVT
jgi:hypothetical protein